MGKLRPGIDPIDNEIDNLSIIEYRFNISQSPTIAKIYERPNSSCRAFASSTRERIFSGPMGNAVEEHETATGRRKLPISRAVDWARHRHTP